MATFPNLLQPPAVDATVAMPPYVQSRNLPPWMMIYLKQDLTRDRSIRPTPTHHLNQELVAGPNLDWYDLLITPDHSEFMRMYRLGQEASVYMEAQLAKVLAHRHRRSIEIPHETHNFTLPPDVYNCELVDVGLTGHARHGFEPTASGYARCNEITRLWGQGPQGLDLINVDHFHNHGLVQPATAGGTVAGTAPRIPTNPYVQRLVLASWVSRSSGLSTNGTPVWYWPMEWDPRVHSQNIRSDSRFFCSHICHNKLCCCPRHIVVEPSKINLLRQYSDLCCQGWIIAEHPYQPGEAAYVVGYSCIHAWGCRKITAVSMTHQQKQTLARLPFHQLRYRTGHLQFSMQSSP